MKTLAYKITNTIQAKKNCYKSNNMIWYENHSDILEIIENKYLPHGSGIDSGCKIDEDKSNENKIVITFGFHHMNENGYYTGWFSYKCICTPAFSGIDIKIIGKNINCIKDYLQDIFYDCLSQGLEKLPF
ncbi:MAG: hypothetical protein PHN56_04010 [Candidatus Nanoarchaeia archaeon]|nr:hypothetical protein [Candidatus Nanoarchaeia archaeon]